MSAFYKALHSVVQEQQPMTVRQVFYQAEVRGLVEKAETGYGKVQRALMIMRGRDIIPYAWIVDNTRWQRKPRTYDGVDDLLLSAAYSYRRAVWSGLDQRLEVWCEKDALAGVLHPVTATMTTLGQRQLVGFLRACTWLLTRDRTGCCRDQIGPGPAVSRCFASFLQGVRQ